MTHGPSELPSSCSHFILHGCLKKISEWEYFNEAKKPALENGFMWETGGWTLIL